MQFNKWTLGLAAVGAVTLASVVQAEEKASSVMTAVSSTMLSGYVDTSAQWNLGTGDSHAPFYKYGGPSKADGFNLDVVKVTLEKPMDDSEWAAGYKVDLLFGPEADGFPNGLGTQSTGVAADFAVKQAYVALRAPVGNGLDFKIGVFDSIIGYESTEAINNPNWTRSWGHTIEPSTHTGVLASYRFNSNLAFSAGIADTSGAAINQRAFSVSGVNGVTPAESVKTYLGSVALTAPDDWGFLAGSSLYGGVVYGVHPVAAGFTAVQANFYTGATVATPVTGLRLGAAYDYAGIDRQALTAQTSYYANATALYGSYQATEKLSLHARVEYTTVSKSLSSIAEQLANAGVPGKDLALTGTVQYDLWKNVISRLEFRWDHALDGRDAFGGNGPTVSYNSLTSSGTLNNSYILAANVIYKF